MPRAGQQLLELGQLDVGPDGHDVARHEARDRRVREPVASALSTSLRVTSPTKRAVVDDRQPAVAPPRHELAGLAHRRRRAQADRTGRAHDVAGRQRRPTPRPRAPARTRASTVRQAHVPEARRRGLGWPPPPSRAITAPTSTSASRLRATTCRRSGMRTTATATR